MKRVADETEEQFRKKCLFEAGVTYSVAAAFPVLASFLVSLIALAAGAGEAQWYRYLAFLLPQLCLAGAAAIYFVRSKDSLRATFRGCKWYYFLLAVAMQFGLFLSLSELNGYFIDLLEIFGYHEAQNSLPDLSGWNLLPAMLVIALLPALCEETIFRGILSRNMHASGWGTAATVLIAGAMFSLFHGNPSQTLYQFVCGICFTLIALRSGSVFPTMAAHFLNNAVILALNSAYAPAFPNGFTMSDIMPQWAYITLLVFSALCLIGSLVYLTFDKRGRGGKGVKWGKAFFFAALAGIVVCAVEWIVVLVTGFLNG